MPDAGNVAEGPGREYTGPCLLTLAFLGYLTGRLTSTVPLPVLFQ